MKEVGDRVSFKKSLHQKLCCFFFLTDGRLVLQISALPPSRTAPACPIQRSPRSRSHRVSGSVKGSARLAIAPGGVASAKAATVKTTVGGA